jgi:hypothetical protein
VVGGAEHHSRVGANSTVFPKRVGRAAPFLPGTVSDHAAAISSARNVIRAALRHPCSIADPPWAAPALRPGLSRAGDAPARPEVDEARRSATIAYPGVEFQQVPARETGPPPPGACCGRPR